MAPSDPARPASPEDLLERFRRRGEPEAFAALFDATAPELHRVAIALTKDVATADDVVQETYIAALRLLPRFQRGRAVIPWLVSLLQRRLQHARRSERRARARVLALAGLGGPASGALGDVVPAAEPTSPEERAALHAALEGLEEPYRAVALLRWRYGLEPVDIARVRGEPAGTTRSLLSRAAERVRSRFRGRLPAAFLAQAGGLGAVRARILEQATTHPTGAPLPPWPASAALARRLLAGAALLALVGGAGILAVAGGRGSIPAAGEPSLASTGRADSGPGLAVSPAATPSLAARAGPEEAVPAAPPPTRLSDLPFAIAASPVDDPALPAERVPLRVTVVDRWGVPVPDAGLQAAWGEWRTGLVRADADGRATLRVPKGTRALEVWGAGADEKRRFLFVHYHPLVGDPAETRVVLRIGAEIAGRLVGEDGEPIRRARVRAVPTAFGFAGAVTDDEGRFRLGALDGDEVDVRFDGEREGVELGPLFAAAIAETDALRAIVRGVVPGRDGDIVLVAGAIARDATLDVRVLGPEGRPEPGALVRVSEGNRARETRADSEGRATFPGLPRWPIAVQVRPAGSSGTRWLLPRVVPDVVPDGARLDVVLVETPALRGRVLDAAGRPVAKAWCAALEGASYVACFPTDEDGRFEAPSNVAAGTRLQVTARYPMEKATSCGVVDGAIAGGSELTIVLREFRPADPDPASPTVRFAVGGSVRVVSR